MRTVNRAPVAEKKTEEDLLPRLLPHLVGTLNYYRGRFVDYVRRHGFYPPPPDYYLDYGDKYAHRFKLETRPKLSDNGKVWVDKTLRLLQEAIEKAVKDEKDFDKWEKDENGALLREYAFDSHPDAYIAGGLATLPLPDLIEILKTPDPEDILKIEGIKQAIITTGMLFAEWARQIIHELEAMDSDTQDQFRSLLGEDVLAVLIRSQNQKLA